MYEIISKMPFNRAMNIIIIIFGCLIAPYWYLFNCFPELINGKDVFQLILICTAISLPSFIVNYTIWSTEHRQLKRKQKIVDFKIRLMTIAALGMSFVFYYSVVWIHIEYLNKAQSIWVLMANNVLLIVVSFFFRFTEKIKRGFRYKGILKRKRLVIKSQNVPNL